MVKICKIQNDTLLDIKESLIKDRSCLIVLIICNDLIFAIPMRSNLKHKFGYKTIGNRGLDFSKAILLQEIPIEQCIINRKEYNVIIRNERNIRNKFIRYVDRYIKLHKGNKINTLKIVYQYSTLQNYHQQLGID